MSWNFCTRVEWKLRRLGFAQKAAARFATCCYLLMVTACGLMGLFFEIPKELFEPISIAGKNHAGTRYGLFSPAVFAIRR